MSESTLGEVMNETLHMSPLLCRVVEDEYGRSCGSSRVVGGPIISRLELEPVKYDASNKPSFFRRIGCCGFSLLMEGLIVSTTPLLGSSY